MSVVSIATHPAFARSKPLEIEQKYWIATFAVQDVRNYAPMPNEHMTDIVVFTNLTFNQLRRIMDLHGRAMHRPKNEHYPHYRHVWGYIPGTDERLTAWQVASARQEAEQME